MNRFQKKPKKLLHLRFFLPLLIFCAVLFLFLGALSGVSQSAAREEAESLEDSVRRGAVQCYALEGFYPESLSYLEEHYGLSYNKEKYVVSYEVIGSNMMPDIMVIPLDKREGDRE